MKIALGQFEARLVIAENAAITRQLAGRAAGAGLLVLPDAAMVHRGPQDDLSEYAGTGLALAAADVQQ
jgi:hypothetical protein